MRQMESDLNGRLETVTLQLQKMPQKSREMSDTTASAWILDPWAPSDQTFEEVLPLVENIGTAHPGERQKTLIESRRCNCANILRRQTKSLRTRTWSLSWSHSITSHHLQTCQYWNPHQEVCSTKLSVFHVNFLAAMALSASIRISKQAGFFWISPSLTLRGVVNGSSPAFALLEDLGKLCEYIPQPYDNRVRMSTLEKQISSVTRSVLRLLKEGAVSPFEVDRNGRTLLHSALSCVMIMDAEDEVHAFRELIDALLDAGVAVNEVDLAGETAFDYLISRWRIFSPTVSKGNSVRKFLTTKGAEMSDVLSIRPLNYTLQISVELQRVAMFEPWQDVNECGPLSSAVLRKSEQDVVRILRAKPSSIQELTRRGQTPMHLACSWPRGIQLLLDAGASYLVHQVDLCGGLPITYSIKPFCLNAIQLLLDAGSALSSPGWMVNSEEVLQILQYVDTKPNFLLTTLQERRRKLLELAKLTLPAEAWADLDVPTDRLLDGRAAEIQRILIDADIEIPKSISVPRRRGTVYHAYVRYVKQADQLWDAGFRDIDSPNDSGQTPIMDIQSRYSLDYVQWLIHHGADPHQEIIYVHDDDDDESQPVVGLTVLHRIAYLFGLEILDSLSRELHPAPQVADEPSRIYEEMLVESDSHDDCHCACSSSGCTPSTILLKTADQEARFYTLPSMKSSDVRRKLVQRVESPGHPASSAPMRSKIGEKVIRFETFEALQLSHTCCVFEESTGRNVSPRRATRRRYTPEDVREIHEEWEEHLSKHEDLVSEFCHKFRELGGTLTSFLECYWQTRMDEVLKEEKPYDEEHIRRLREIGVVLEEVSEERENCHDEVVNEKELTDEVSPMKTQLKCSNEEEEEHNKAIQPTENNCSR